MEVEVKKLQDIKGIGEKLSDKILESVGGEDNLNTIVNELDIESIKNIEGISGRKAIGIMNQLLDKPTEDFIKSERAYQIYEEILDKKEKPSLEDIIWLSKVYARMSIGFDSTVIVSHRQLLTFKDKFEKVGLVEIKQSVRRMGRWGGDVYTFDEFCDNWGDTIGRGETRKNFHELLEL